MRTIIFLFVVLISNFLLVQTHAYEYKPAGIMFNHNNLSINEKSGRQTPLSIVFQSGVAPFTVSVLFKEVSEDGTIDNFIQKEIQQHKQGGYTKEITISKVNLKGTDAYEIIRDSKIVKVRWYIFVSQRNKKLYSFWFAENNMLKKENTLAIEGYEEMKTTLQLSQ